jgi:DNA-binding GntR family transcriptional regulator
LAFRSDFGTWLCRTWAFSPLAVEKHLDLVEAIKAGNADRAEQITRSHVQDFYDKVREI